MFSSAQLALLRCPYCGSELKIEKKIVTPKLTAGYCRCNCAVFPFFDNIFFLQKDDTLANKRAVELIKKGEIWQAFFVCFIYTARAHRFLVRALWWLWFNYDVILPLPRLLYLFSFFGGARSWFLKLLQGTVGADLQIASLIFNNQSKIIADIGCATGLFYDALSEKKLDRKIKHFVGIDKSFLSLVIFWFYHRSDKKILLVCADLGAHLPLSGKTFDAIFILRTFPWIWYKTNLLKEAARALASGNINVIGMHDDANDSSAWGYGCHPRVVEQMAKAIKWPIKFIDYEQTLQIKRPIFLPLSKTNPSDYSFVLGKKLKLVR